jgi:hypothetical protein
MEQPEDWRRKPWRLVGLVAAFAAAGSMLGDELGELLYWIGLRERPPWKQ